MLLGLFLKGVAVGAAIAVPVGPVGVLCVRRTLVGGRLAGVVSGLGAAAGDTLFGIVAAFGLSFVSGWLLDVSSWLAAGGGCFLLVLGARAILFEPPGDSAPDDRRNLFGDFVSTLLLTLANPLTILVFFGVFATLGFAGAQATPGHAAILVSGVCAGSLIWWLTLGFGVARFLAALSRHDRNWIGRGAGGILLLSGAGLLIALARTHIG
jgi:threonine/homoserine/homoserine lactone efflux protein